MRYVLMIALITMLFTASCTGPSGLETADNLYMPERLFQPEPVAIPFPDEIRADSSVPLQLEVLGRETWDRSPQAMVDNDDLLLPALPGQSNWAVYRLYTGGYAHTEIGFELADTTVAEKVWIGVPDYFKHKWVWQQYSAGMGSVDVSTTASLSSLGNSYFAVLTYDDTLTRVKRCFIDIEVPSWNSYVLDSSASPGDSQALVRLGNLIGIIYESGDGAGGYELKMLHSTALAPAGPPDWNTTDILVSYADPVLDLDLIKANNLPGMAMLIKSPSPGYTSVWYARGNVSQPLDPSGWAWSNVGTGVVGDGLDLALIDGNPAVVYEGQELNSGFSVRYARASVPEPVNSLDWDVLVAGDSFSPTQDYSGMHLFSLANTPAIMYYDVATQQLRYAHSALATPTGPLDFSFCNVDSQPLLGQLNTGLEYGGRPVCIYTSPLDGMLHYARGTSSDPAGPEDFYQRQVIEQRFVDQRLEVIRPPLGMGLAYREMTDNTVMYAWTESATPTSGRAWRIVQVDDRPTTGDIGLGVMQDGNPCVSYHTLNPDALQFAVMVP